MKLTNLIEPDLIKLELASGTKPQVLEELINLMVETSRIKDRDEFVKAVMDREAICSTGIGKGIAIPHSRNTSITEVTVALGRSRAGIDFDALDNEPVHLVFLLAAPMNAGNVYLKALARLSRLLRMPEFRQAIMEANTKEDIIRIIEERE
ncbi:MAG: PTS sugar transporter subunit IIA [Candidatus Wallbacteria bacterium]|nr:PTS sugar transporter subunit IIA [Candidatus Wallbacteria bacterium]